jgi:hypothetical protein
MKTRAGAGGPLTSHSGEEVLFCLANACRGAVVFLRDDKCLEQHTGQPDAAGPAVVYAPSTCNPVAYAVGYAKFWR